MQITINKVVTIDYTLTDDEGDILDQSDDGQFAYLHGASNIIPGLEQALEGKASGDSLTVRVPPEMAYGVWDEELSQTVPANMFQTDEPIEPGMQFRAQSADGSTMVVTVTEVEGDKVTIDGNHPLAGQNLTFDVRVVAVRDASAEEMEHGHAH